MSEPSKVHSHRSLQKHPTSSLVVLRTLMQLTSLVCPNKVLNPHRKLIVLTNLHDTEGPRGLFNSLVVRPVPLYLSFPAQKGHLYLLPGALRPGYISLKAIRVLKQPFCDFTNCSFQSICLCFCPSAQLYTFCLHVSSLKAEHFHYLKKKEALIL